MKAVIDGTTVRLGQDGASLYEQGGYGRPDGAGLRLAFEEALYLLLRGKIEVPGHTFESLLATFAGTPDFLRRFLVYRDIRERGYVIQPGPQDFRVFRRGEKPGRGRSQYLVRVISERAVIGFDRMAADGATALHMRKTYVLAVVDDENELTYYEVKMPDLPSVESPPLPSFTGAYAGTAVVAAVPESAGSEERAWFGTPLDAGRLMLSPLEIIYLRARGKLAVAGDPEGEEVFLARVAAADAELAEKQAVYTHLRDLGYMPRTAYKFGHHFRVYTGKKKHSEMLVHALPPRAEMPMSIISRSVRLAHSVRKKMLFACVNEDMIRYIEFGRIKL
ncbi:MAG: tRNA-intron lyase [Methanomicrobiales archaeon]|nr:tRNA-intron lyase [Methanomicrobiales archaeon]